MGDASSPGDAVRAALQAGIAAQAESARSRDAVAANEFEAVDDEPDGFAAAVAMQAAGGRRALGRRRRANLPAGEAGGRARRYEVRVSPGEDAVLRARAAVRDVTVPRLLFEAATAANVEIDAERKRALVMLFALQRELASVANNVNQLARFANTEGRFPADAAAVVEEYKVLTRRVDAAITVVSGR